MAITETSLLGALAFTSGSSAYTFSSDLGVLAVLDDFVSANNTKTSELGALAIVNGVASVDNVPSTSMLGVLAIYGEGATEDFRLRAWGFTMDGHRFYVLHLGEQGTFVYDFTTKQWSEWKTEGFATGWNAHVGQNWGADDRIIAADRENPIIWLVDPTTFRDEGYKDIRRTATAIIPNSGMSYRTHDSLMLYASVGDPSAPSPTIEMTYSDDQGVTYEAPEDSIIVLTPGDNGQSLEWLSLGSFPSPGRVIDITDYGGVGRIDRACVEVR